MSFWLGKGKEDEDEKRRPKTKRLTDDAVNSSDSDNADASVAVRTGAAGCASAMAGAKPTQPASREMTSNFTEVATRFITKCSQPMTQFSMQPCKRDNNGL